MSLRFQRLALILITLVILGAAVLLILFNTKKNIIFFYTPTELIEKKISSGDRVRIGGYVKNSSLKQISLNQYKFKITDNKTLVLNKKEAFVDTFISSLRKKINDPLGIKKAK